ncbi:MAG: 6,7-dimethyl-8-ribityllumazine synthase [Dehalococcoidia bacterium]
MAEKINLDKFFEKKYLDGSSLRIGIVVSIFNDEITSKMFNIAYNELIKNGVDEKKIKKVNVPGAFELPIMCKKMAETKKFDSIIALGVVIKGETDHYDFVATNATTGISNTSLITGIPIIFGILTTDNYDQASDRIIDSEYYAKTSIIVPNTIKYL